MCSVRTFQFRDLSVSDSLANLNRRGSRPSTAVCAAAGCLVAAIAAGIFAWYRHGDNGTPDFDQLYFGAMALRRGLNPYAAVGPHALYEWGTRLYYPLPALVAVLPLTVFPVRFAAALFVAASGFALGWAVETRGDRWAYVLLATNAFLSGAASGQWSVLLLAAAWLPVAGVAGIAKPNVAILSAAYWTRLRDFLPALMGGSTLLCVAFVLRPRWPVEWIAVLGRTPWQHAAILYPGGWLVLAALTRWRRPEARYLVAYALLPQTPGPYTDLMLFAVPRGRWQYVWLALLSGATWPITRLIRPSGPQLDRVATYGAVSVVVLLLPCVAMVLRRPNVGGAPAWAERWVARAPQWLRGNPAGAHGAAVE